MNFEIDTLDNQIGQLNSALKDAKQLRGSLEKDLLELGFNIQELRTLRKGQVSTSESYVPEQSEKLPEYTPTPKQGEESAMDIDLTTEPVSIQPLSEAQPTAQAQAIPQEAEGVTCLLPSKRTLANIGLTPEKYAKLLATNLQAPSQVSKEPSVPSTSTANPFSLPLPIQRSQVTVPPPSLPEADSEVSMSLPPLPLLPGMPSEESVSEVGASKTSETTTEAVSVSGLNQPEIITVTPEMAVKSITKEQNRYVCPFISCGKDYAHKSDCNKHVKEHFKPKEQHKIY